MAVVVQPGIKTPQRKHSKITIKHQQVYELGHFSQYDDPQRQHNHCAKHKWYPLEFREIPLFQRLLTEPDIIDGHYDIHWLENYLARDT